MTWMALAVVNGTFAALNWAFFMVGGHWWSAVAAIPSTLMFAMLWRKIK